MWSTSGKHTYRFVFYNKQIIQTILFLLSGYVCSRLWATKDPAGNDDDICVSSKLAHYLHRTALNPKRWHTTRSSYIRVFSLLYSTPNAILHLKIICYLLAAPSLSSAHPRNLNIKLHNTHSAWCIIYICVPIFCLFFLLLNSSESVLFPLSSDICAGIATDGCFHLHELFYTTSKVSIYIIYII